MSDVISRQAVLDGLASIAKAKAKSDAQKSLMGRVMFFVEQLPSAEKTGQFVRHYSRPGVYADLWWHCTNCGYKAERKYNYCPGCGVKIAEGEDQQDETAKGD